MKLFQQATILLGFLVMTEVPLLSQDLNSPQAEKEQAQAPAKGDEAEQETSPKEVSNAKEAVVAAKEGVTVETGKPVSEQEAEAAEEAQAKEREVDPDEQYQVLGWKEWVQVGTKSEPMRAKLDSGARTSSLHAEGAEEFERDGRKWVRFSLKNPQKKEGKSILIKAPLQRVAKVKNTDGTMERRFVVELGFTIGERTLREEFTLNDRSGFTCPILIGRNALRHLGFVDCSRVDLAEKKIFK